MAFNLNWGLAHPGHLVYLLDLSRSMLSKGKIDQLLEIVKASCNLLLSKCAKGMSVKNRFSLSIIGYNTVVHTLFEGTAIDLDRKMDEIYKQGKDTPMFDKTIELENGGCHPNRKTYTAKAFRAVKTDIEKWIVEQQQEERLIPVPVIYHLTDGEPKESERSRDEARRDALLAAEEIKSISLPDGHPILFNIHIGNGNEPKLLLPSERPDDKVLQFLYDSCSIMDSKTDYGIISMGSIYGPPAMLDPNYGEFRCMASGVKNLGSLLRLF